MHRPEPGPTLDGRSSDEPLFDPELDLLGIARHAEVLAAHIKRVPTPLTIGVYGEWGAGKTTFVNFVQHYLDPDKRRSTDAPAFVHFEAWAYRTADELWRALTTEIARAVYARRYPGTFDPHPSDRAGQPDAPESRTWWQRLTEDAVVIGGARSPPTANDEFQGLLRQLDATMYGGISKRPSDTLRLDQDQAVASAVKASLSALGALSPAFAAIRRLFGGGQNGLDVSSILQREQNEATRERIESRSDFQAVLKRLLQLLPPGVRLCVFLDDLDRCMPDVVLDLLEAIKIFLDVPGVVFVVAADETLIGKGLRLRFKDLLDAAGSESERDFLARKGQEYFEKIIQLRINLPECTPAHGHAFIAAQFPEWMPATDIILAAVGSNPRRIKQYCSWLAFRRSVDQAAPAAP